MLLPPTSELAAVGLAWARVMPTVTIVPAFGLRALPQAGRAILGLALAAGIYPALRPVVARADGPWLVQALEQIALGLPVALAAAIPLWAATMVGGLADALRGASDTADAPVVEGRAGSFGILLSTFASFTFLATGGPARCAAALAILDVGPHPLLAAARDLATGITIAVSIGGPLLAASVVLELAFALVARAASPAQVHALFAPIRALGLLAVVALVLERIAALVATTTRAAP